MTRRGFEFISLPGCTCTYVLLLHVHAAAVDVLLCTCYVYCALAHAHMHVLAIASIRLLAIAVWYRCPAASTCSCSHCATALAASGWHAYMAACGALPWYKCCGDVSTSLYSLLNSAVLLLIFCCSAHASYSTSTAAVCSAGHAYVALWRCVCARALS